MKLKKGTTFCIINPFKEDEIEKAVKNTIKIFKKIGLILKKEGEVKIELTKTKLPEGAYHLKIIPHEKKIVIKSENEEGFRCGLYSFLEFIGVRWFSPEMKIVLPNLPITLYPLEEKNIPSFPYRGLHICGSPFHFDKKVAEWMNFLKMNRKLTHHEEVDIIGKELLKLGLKPDTTVHSYSFWISDDRYFQKHPEWFALVGGKRITQKEGGQLCLANKEMRNEFVENIKKFLDKHPEISIVGICPNDGYGWCECEKCRMLDSKLDRKKGTVNGRVADFVSDIAERLKKINTKILVGHYSYSNFADFYLEKENFPDNIIISCTLWRCFKHSIDNPNCHVNRPIYERIKKLRGKFKHLYVYEYYTYHWNYLPAPIWKVVRDDMLAYHKLGCDGFLSEVGPAKNSSYKSFHLALYVASKYLYSINTDLESILEDYCEKRFGPAKNIMLQYFKTLEEGMEKMDTCFTHKPEDFEKMFTSNVRKKAGLLLEKAVLKTKTTKDYEKNVKEEKKLFDLWNKIAIERPMYRYSSKITPLPLNELKMKSNRKDKLVLVENVSLIPPRRNKTFLSVYADKENIGFLIECYEQAMDKLTIKKSNTLEAVYESDCIEIFLSNARNTDTIYHIMINAGGYNCASECKGTRWNWSWNGNYTANVKIFHKRWIVFFTIPKVSIGANKKFYFSVVRNRKINGWEITGIPEGGAYFNPEKYLEVSL